MVSGVERLSTRTVVVGSGPGGATVARGLAKRGEDVLVLERGAYHRRIGTWPTMFRMMDRMGMLTSEEGTMMVRLLTVGGSTVTFCGVALPPPAWLKERHGIDLSAFVTETQDELDLAPLPERLLGEGALRIQDAARKEGFAWNPLPKFIDPSLCDLSCPKCMIGCVKGAKWTARKYVDEAVGAHARLVTQARVDEVLYDGGRVTGVRGTSSSGAFVVEAERVVLAAGGIGTAVILKASGFADAGRGFFIDPLQLTTAISPWQGSSHDIPMTCGTTDLADEGIIMTDVIDPWPLYMFGLVMGGPRNPKYFVRYPRTLSIMTKSRDPLTGSISADGRVSKPFGEQEQAMLRRGSEIAQRILRRAGCHMSTVMHAAPRGAHPGGTVRIGEMLDNDLQTSVAGLYVCDASVLPEPCGWPPVLTIISLGKRLVQERL
ncbi:MAG: GMC family oxidoreductase N-terminal domain-containing protein [Actinobacteria bacterium]|nr:GMC family oxidoreductase N-terminal domain-containing protein [Actinomycetota bacterium]